MATSRRDLATDVWGALLRAHAAVVPQLDHELRNRTGLPVGSYDVLLELSVAPDGRLTMSELSERAVLSRTRISRVVDELCADGLVSRTRHPTDGRSSYATLTARGRERFRRAAPVYVGAIERYFADGLTVEELRVLRTALERVVNSSGTT